MTLRRALQSIAAITAVAALAFVQAKVSHAAFHLIQVREVYPGSVSNPNSEYVVLQMWAPGQNFVSGHSVRTFGPTGTPTGTTTFNGSVANGGNQATILVGTAEAAAQFRVGLDAQMPAGGHLDPAGGAVCWEEGLDCVSWGNFTGSLPSLAGTPAPAIPDGSALRRSIVPGCATLLESGDDTNNSAMDFSAVTSAPRPNSVAPTETACAIVVTEAPLPNTVLGKKPPKRTRDRTPSFRFASDQKAATFECKIDRKPFRSCRSPYTAKPLKPGRHVFKVRAVAFGSDPSPASSTFTILGRRPHRA